VFFFFFEKKKHFFLVHEKQVRIQKKAKKQVYITMSPMDKGQMRLSSQ